MSNKKQTAVEFLVKEFSSILGPIKTTPMQDLLLVDAINKTKELEKQQHGQTWDYAMQSYEERGGVFARAWSDFEDYYNETYGGNNG